MSRFLILSSKSGSFWSCLSISGIFYSKIREISSLSLVLIMEKVRFYSWEDVKGINLQILFARWVKGDCERCSFYLYFQLPLLRIKLIILLNLIPNGVDISICNTVINDFNIIAREELFNITHKSSTSRLLLHSFINKLINISYISFISIILITKTNQRTTLWYVWNKTSFFLSWSITTSLLLGSFRIVELKMLLERLIRDDVDDFLFHHLGQGCKSFIDRISTLCAAFIILKSILTSNLIGFFVRDSPLIF